MENKFGKWIETGLRKGPNVQVRAWALPGGSWQTVSEVYECECACVCGMHRYYKKLTDCLCEVSSFGP